VIASAVVAALIARVPPVTTTDVPFTTVSEPVALNAICAPASTVAVLIAELPTNIPPVVVEVVAEVSATYPT